MNPGTILDIISISGISLVKLNKAFINEVAKPHKKVDLITCFLVLGLRVCEGKEFCILLLRSLDAVH